MHTNRRKVEVRCRDQFTQVVVSQNEFDHDRENGVSILFCNVLDDAYECRLDDKERESHWSRAASKMSSMVLRLAML